MTASLLRRLAMLFSTRKPVSPRDGAMRRADRDAWLGKQSRAVCNAARRGAY